MASNYTPAMRRGAAADLDAKLGAPPRLTFFGVCVCDGLVIEHDDGTALEWPSRRPHTCTGASHTLIIPPLVAPQRAPQAAEAPAIERPRPRGVLDLGG